MPLDQYKTGQSRLSVEHSPSGYSILYGLSNAEVRALKAADKFDEKSDYDTQTFDALLTQFLRKYHMRKSGAMSYGSPMFDLRNSTVEFG